MSKRITLRDVAQKAGFSLAAVSLALRDSPQLPVATRKHVCKVARELGYQFDPMLAALAAHRWNRHPSNQGVTLAVLAEGNNVEGEKGMRERATAMGYQLEVFQIRDYPDPKRLADILYNRGILGIIVAQISTPGFCATFDWSRFIAVACSEGSERPPVHLIMPNHFKAVQDAWDHAWAAGYRRIGLMLFDDPRAIDYHERCAAFLERQRMAADAQRIPLHAITLVRVDPEIAARALRDVDAWMRQWKPEVILGFSNFFCRLLHDAGWLSPDKFRFYDLWISQMPSLNPGMYLSQDEVGRRAVEYLGVMLQGGERGIPDHPATIAINFIWRESAPKSKGKGKRTAKQ